jgi:3-dehydroquinate dehydratase/shikimate dehydrogenase
VSLVTVLITHRLAVCLMKDDGSMKVCVPVCVERATELDAEVARAADLADMIELRLDCLLGAELYEALANLNELLRSYTRTFILTLRAVEQGGRREMDALNRFSFWIDQFARREEYTGFVDIELGLTSLFAEKEATERVSLDWQRVICSHHEFSSLASNLEAIYERMTKTPARVLKLAVQVNDITDCLPIFQLLARARREGREMIAIAMGEAGIVTRILGPSRGAFLTYGALDAAHATAPGQITASDLRELYRIDKLDEQTAIMGLVGAPVAHSVSPQMHNAAFKECGLNAVYLPLEVHDAAAFIRRMVRPRSRELDWKLRGLSITAPHKSVVLDEIDWVEPSAREIGAVNTILIEGEELRGYNTDARAFLTPLEKSIEAIGNRRFALIGAGGVARSVLWALRRAGASVTVFARSLKDASALAESFDALAERLKGASFSSFDVVINATPLGTHGLYEDQTPAIAEQLRGAHLVYDLVYNPTRTRLLSEAEEAGCETLGGLSMLVAQAAEQFELWTGQAAPLEVMREAARRALEE